MGKLICQEHTILAEQKQAQLYRARLSGKRTGIAVKTAVIDGDSSFEGRLTLGIEDPEEVLHLFVREGRYYSILSKGFIGLLTGGFLGSLAHFAWCGFVY